jgi:hypothetical protein
MHTFYVDEFKTPPVYPYPSAGKMLPPDKDFLLNALREWFKNVTRP